MFDVIDFIFNTLNDLFTLINSNWILQIFILLAIIRWYISNIKDTGDKK